MITLMNASAARKESELNMKFAAKSQWEEIENMINAAVRAGEFEVQLKKRMYEKNYIQLKELGYKVKSYLNSEENRYWSISW